MASNSMSSSDSMLSTCGQEENILIFKLTYYVICMWTRRKYIKFHTNIIIMRIISLNKISISVDHFGEKESNC